MYLRNLELKDADFMLEWMHDEDVVNQLKGNFLSKTKSDVIKFIESSKDTSSNLHLAICSDSDEYMGTVSLKNIDQKRKIAEFAIAVRKKAMNCGYSWFGMDSIIKRAFDLLDLECVYWCVSKNNNRALSFYNKHNFHEVFDIPEDVINRYDKSDGLKWYSVLKGDVLTNVKSIVGCKIIKINTVSSLGIGELSFFDDNNDINFNIKRIYYISKVPEGSRRGFHAHKNLKQLLFCPYGRIQLILENELGRKEVELSDPSVGVIIEKTTWREMIWLQKNSVLCVAASDYYDEKDYIRDYDEFKKYLHL
ncbi:Protein N-acetyltransferase, RimJ/RimL family [Succinivibrio dextrinosolvens DSM 3072]|uniref:Protein N-acetyltransferase, RimJ/RimL family n=1 Tax=Succinivibrio dextrinosolvens DSM 3072 TaxID=1123324 RepID=A0A1T4VBL3_9GAMM|nr:GNAT family N-acetyltransferase [Succinivibrio dextrinosolvens]SKA62326.1 Protein N-acetyltransferase, RimJ/RimL family [Succinivibrio dextrinosolvens DSM 3072]